MTTRALVRSEVIASGKVITILSNPERCGKPHFIQLVCSVVWGNAPDERWFWNSNDYPSKSCGQFYQDSETKEGYVAVIIGGEVTDVYEISKLHLYQLVGRSRNTGPVYERRGISVEQRLTLKQKIATALGREYQPLFDEVELDCTLRRRAHENRVRIFNEFLKNRCVPDTENSMPPVTIGSLTFNKGGEAMKVSVYSSYPTAGLLCSGEIGKPVTVAVPGNAADYFTLMKISNSGINYLGDVKGTFTPD